VGVRVGVGVGVAVRVVVRVVLVLLDVGTTILHVLLCTTFLTRPRLANV